MAGEEVQFASQGASCAGYLARPQAAGAGVIVIQEWWGLVDHIKDVADRFAAEGFVALAPDLYHGEATSDPDDAGRLMMALNIDRATRDLGAAIDYLLALPEVGSSDVGVVGFCMGGQLALAAACQHPRVGACVDFYGVHPNVTLDFSGLRAPVLGLFAEQDQFVTPEVARKLEHDLREAGKKTDFHIYPGADHAFFNDTRPDAYNADAAADAWGRVLALFHEQL